jgi:hypothetical protein
MTTGTDTVRSAPLWLNVVLWVAAAVLMFAAADYQERTGPTKELRGAFELGGVEHAYELIRSGNSYEDARVAIPMPGEESVGALHFKRFGTDDEFLAVPLVVEGEELTAALPRQPAAGKLEYFLVVSMQSHAVRIPETAEENVIIRFKDAVPIGVLVPHIVFMFFALLVGMRTALSAIFTPPDMKSLAWVTLSLMTVGGLVLGPVVQKFAFGAYWTGIPFGYDLTDNKTLIMWIVWVGACGLFLWKGVRNVLVHRIAIVAAALVMIVVYLIPHSLRGSELDYEALDQGTPPSEAVRTGDRG